MASGRMAGFGRSATVEPHYNSISLGTTRNGENVPFGVPPKFLLNDSYVEVASENPAVRVSYFGFDATKVPNG